MFITKFTLPVVSLLILGALTYGVGLVLCPALVAGPPGPQQRDAAPADVGKERIEKIKAGKALPVADMSGDRINVLLAGIKAGDKMGELVKGQLEAAKTELDARWQEFLAGRGTLDIMLGSSQRLLQAEFDLSTKRSDRIAALEAHWQRLREVETINQSRYDAGRIPIQDLAQSRSGRCRAEILLERAKKGQAIDSGQL
ncbi:MAG TPA: hypothetical protein VK395_05840 [Gemmataceae bacterium]|nr:hypothetical protein [Gemmataceae bacterium]